MTRSADAVIANDILNSKTHLYTLQKSHGQCHSKQDQIIYIHTWFIRNMTNKT